MEGCDPIYFLLFQGFELSYSILLALLEDVVHAEDKMRLNLWTEVLLVSLALSIPYRSMGSEVSPSSPTCDLNDQTLRLRSDLVKRGFKDAAFTQACSEVARFAPHRSDQIPEIAVLDSLEFTDRQKRDFLKRDVSLEDFLTRKYRRYRKTGIVMLSAGVAVVVLGIVMRYYPDDPDQNEGSNEADFNLWDKNEMRKTFALIPIIIGSAASLTGGILISIGYGDKAKFPPTGLLETGSEAEIRKWYFKKNSSTANRRLYPQIAISPLVSEQSGGLMLRINF